MVVSRNYFDVTSKLKSIIFNNTTISNNTQIEFNFKNDKGGVHYYCLSYYEFNILLSQTIDQKTVYHSLTDEFFDEFSLHKNKMFFCGLYEDLNNTFTSTEINYKIPPKKLGLYVRKRLINGFADREIHIELKKNINGVNDVTRFLVL